MPILLMHVDKYILLKLGNICESQVMLHFQGTLVVLKPGGSDDYNSHLEISLVKYNE